MEKKIKVCHFTSAHPDYDERIFLKECISLAKAGYEVSLLAPNASTKEIEGVKIIGVKNDTNSRLKRILFFTKKIYKAALKVNADIYHFHDPELLPFGYKLKKKGKKVIYDVHEDLPRQILSKFWIKPFLRKFISKNIEIYENFVSRKMDFIISATPCIKDRFIKINKNTDDIKNFPLLSEFHNKGDWTQKCNDICYIGGISQIRGSTELIVAMAGFSDIILHLAGKYSDSEYQKELMKLSGWKNVKEYGFVTRKEVKDILVKSIAGIVTFLPVPNHIEAQPNKMFEYMSAGIPVIGSDFPMWKEVLEGYKCGICVNPENSDEIAKAINYLMENPEKAREMGQNGRKAVETIFNWETEEKKLLGIYHNLR